MPKDNLIERLREAVMMEYSAAISERDKLDETTLGHEAADEIARLKGENAEKHTLVEEFRHAWEEAEAALSRNQALIEEMVEGLNAINRIISPGSRMFDEMIRDMGYACDRVRTLIAKATEPDHAL